MKGNADVINALNEALSEELTAINQYFLHAEMCESWGFGKLSAFIKKESVDEMKHAEALIERILFLEGTPNMTKYQQITIGQTVPEMLKNDLNLEAGAVVMYNKFIDIAAKAGDNGTAELLKKILKDEEGHLDGLEELLDQIEKIGLQNFLALQV